MNKRSLLLIGALVVAAVGGAVAWYLASPLFINTTVDESFPIELPNRADQAQKPEKEMGAMEVQSTTAVPSEDELIQTAEPEGPKDVEAAGMPEELMDEPIPVYDQPVVVSQGQFQDADAVHRGSGAATIYQLPEGRQVLRFEDFSATNGPDLHVLLAGNPAPTGQADLGGYLDLGSLKGNVGNQNYELPEGTDMAQFGSIVIYCKPFHVVFSVAALG